MRRIPAVLLAALSTAAWALEPRARVPSVSAPRLGEPGAPIELRSLKGKVVYVDFWASWCVPCRLSMPTLEELYKKNRSRGFAVVGVNKDATPADAKRFLARVPVSFALVRDGTDEAARGFDVKAMPSGYLIDRKGVVRVVHRGFTAETGAALEKEIDSLLKEPS